MISHTQIVNCAGKSCNKKLACYDHPWQCRMCAEFYCITCSTKIVEVHQRSKQRYPEWMLDEISPPNIDIPEDELDNYYKKFINIIETAFIYGSCEKCAKKMVYLATTAFDILSTASFPIIIKYHFNAIELITNTIEWRLQDFTVMPKKSFGIIISYVMRHTLNFVNGPPPPPPPPTPPPPLQPQSDSEPSPEVRLSVHDMNDGMECTDSENDDNGSSSGSVDEHLPKFTKKAPTPVISPTAVRPPTSPSHPSPPPSPSPSPSSQLLNTSWKKNTSGLSSSSSSTPSKDVSDAADAWSRGFDDGSY